MSQSDTNLKGKNHITHDNIKQHNKTKIEFIKTRSNDYLNQELKKFE